MLDVMYEIPSLSGVRRVRGGPRRRRQAAPPAASSGRRKPRRLLLPEGLLDLVADQALEVRARRERLRGRRGARLRSDATGLWAQARLPARVEQRLQRVDTGMTARRRVRGPPRRSARGARRAPAAGRPARGSRRRRARRCPRGAWRRAPPGRARAPRPAAAPGGANGTVGMHGPRAHHRLGQHRLLEEGEPGDAEARRRRWVRVQHGVDVGPGAVGHEVEAASPGGRAFAAHRPHRLFGRRERDDEIRGDRGLGDGRRRAEDLAARAPTDALPSWFATHLAREGVGCIRRLGRRVESEPLFSGVARRAPPLVGAARPGRRRPGRRPRPRCRR